MIYIFKIIYVYSIFKINIIYFKLCLIKKNISFKFYLQITYYITDILHICDVNFIIKEFLILFKYNFIIFDIIYIIYIKVLYYCIFKILYFSKIPI